MPPGILLFFRMSQDLENSLPANGNEATDSLRESPLPKPSCFDFRALLSSRSLQIGLILLFLGGTTLTLGLPVLWTQIAQWQLKQENQRYEQESQQPSRVLKLAMMPAAQRQSPLQAIASQPQNSLERSRARYLLASDLLKKFEGGPAVRWLENLEADYPWLAPYILLKRGRGYQLSNENIRAQETWQEVLRQYPDSPAAAEALNLLGEKEPQYWQQALEKYPHHPRTLAILHRQLGQAPQSWDLMRQILALAPTAAKTAAIRDTLVTKAEAQLTPEDWQLIGEGYWDDGNYEQAVLAYSRATVNPQTLYRLARSQQLSEQKKAAIATYQKLLQTYPQSQETAKSLKRLAGMVPLPQALVYLDQLMGQFPHQGADALVQKAELLEKTDPQQAASLRNTLLKKYSASEAAANYRWQRARQLAQAGNLSQAWQWAQELASQNPDSEPAAKAVFWIGKWAQQLNRPQDATAAFKNVIARYPQSYYAWRSAVLLGLPVGDFNSLRFLNPSATLPQQRPLPPAGSSLFKELYRLGQDADAMTVFASETGGNPNSLGVDQNFTLALLQLEQGQYLQGINQIVGLRYVEEPRQKQQWQALRQTPVYWQALFPFPYQKLIFDWSSQRQLNPLLVTALIRQESRFEKEIRSPAGATGLMQVMPSTADWIAPQIKLSQYDLTNPQDNVNLGTWYFQHTHKTYQNNSALAVASYNAGPGNVANWLAKHPNQDPDLFIEKIPFPETKGYVESVFGNYWNYLRIYDPAVAPQLQRLLS